MIFVLYGLDTYRSREKLREIIEEYHKKAGPDFNLEKLDAEENNLSGLKNMVQGGSLFSAKKLLILENVFSEENNFERILEAVQKTSGLKSIFLILWDRGLDAGGIKRLEKVKTLADRIQEFKVLADSSLRTWLDQEVKKRSLKLSQPQYAFLVSLGGDLWRISNELDKLSLFVSSAGQPASQEYNVFNLGDTFFVSPKPALGTLLNLLHQGHDDFNLFSYLVNHGRTLLTIKTYLDKGTPVPSRHNLHPYVIKKALGLARGFSQEKLQSLPGKFFEEDFKIKVGLSQPKESLLRILFNY